MRILVTGGTGHLGCAIGARLQAPGHSIRVLARHGEYTAGLQRSQAKLAGFSAAARLEELLVNRRLQFSGESVQGFGGILDRLAVRNDYTLQLRNARPFM